MKKIIALMMTMAMLLPCAALAQEYFTLSEIREQAAAGWHETYTDKYGRETVVDIDVEVFGEDVAPIVKVKPSKFEIDTTLLEEGTVLTDKTVYRNNPADDIFGARSGQVTMDVHHTYGEKIDMNTIYGEESGAPLTMQQLKDRASEVLAPQGISLNDILFDQPKEFSVRCKMKTKSKEVIAPAAYLVHFWQTMYGLPIIESISSAYSPQPWPCFAPQVQISMRGEDEYSMTLWKTEETECLAQDIPLASFETVKQSVKEKIESGHVQKVYSMRFAYAVFNDVDYPKDMESVFDAECYYLVPTWIVECVYMDKPSKTWTYSGRSTDEWMDNEKNSTGYYMMMINAQTGEVYNRNDKSLNGRGDPSFKGFIPWDKVN